MKVLQYEPYRKGNWNISSNHVESANIFFSTALLPHMHSLNDTHSNRCVFDGATPSLAGALVLTGEERRLWEMAGARGLSLLTATLPGG
uniref:Uncharacterized protein n=1 Tax=Arundo donax TaxID=35708 RepID=A0A0A8ZUQ5_ARUDO